MEKPPKGTSADFAHEEEIKQAIAEGRAEPVEAGAYRRLEKAAGELAGIIDDPNMPEEFRDRLRQIAADMNLSEKGARELHTGKMHAENIVVRDALTGLPNRLAFGEELNARISHAERFSADALYAFNIDIDKFKPINDTYGHEAGDLYLQLIAKYVKDAFRPSDVFARLGGDEFSALLSIRSQEGEEASDYDTEMPAIAERVRHAVYLAKCDLRDQLNISAPEKPLLEVDEHSGNASVGYARFEPQKDTSESFLKRADSAMYKDKKRKVDRHFVS